MEEFLILASVMGVLVLCVVVLDKRQKRLAEKRSARTVRAGGSAPPAVGDPLCSTARLIRIITDHNHPAWQHCKKTVIYSREEANNLARMGTQIEKVRVVKDLRDPRFDSADKVRVIKYGLLNRDEYHNADKVQILDCPGG